ncbi:hypothetical protein FR483_n431R [Paramecium bursaria Chlorella virus FR483]|uniref:Uncharacterized protein n431R n=1 Tax=Paramecium bursaria Chlorella virus FR483 TaxID=399781 RepID=A7J7D5_PBCVF|nr:hypothetical protein FR483_n431R [Paramecium bursaria Chlorella virus FR483]ABT15716.1 hypothetical protein FR483_n431R [Paramecium bursaria Chlorella virus FR483]
MLDVKGSKSLYEVIKTTMETILFQLVATLLLNATKKLEENVVSFMQVAAFEGKHVGKLGTGCSCRNHSRLH